MRGSSIAMGWLGLWCWGALACSAAAPCPAPPRAAPQPSEATVAAAPALDESTPPRSEACPIWYSQLDETPAVIPSRFAAAVPDNLKDLAMLRFLGSETAPPWAYLRDGICHGDAAVATRVREALERAAASGLTTQELDFAFSELFRWCPRSAELCALARRELTEHAHPASEMPYHEALESCDDEETTRFYNESNVAPLAYVNWVERHPQPDSPRLRRLATEVMKSGALKDAATAARLVVELKTPDAHGYLLGVQRKLPDPDRRAAVGTTFRDIPKAQAEYRRSCQRAAQIDDLRLTEVLYCRPARVEERAALSPGAKTIQRYVDTWYGKPVERTSEEVTRMTAELEQCMATETDRDVLDDCLAELGAVAPERAREIAKQHLDDANIEVREIARGILRFPDNAANARELERLGLKASGKPASLASPRHRTIYLLQNALELPWNIEPPMGNPTSLLYELRRHMSGLESLLFEQPPVDLNKLRALASGPGGVPALMRAARPPRYWAYDGAHRYDAGSGSPTDSLNLVAMVGLMNSLARTVGSRDRVAIAAHPRWEKPTPITFVFGPQAALCELDRSHLLRLVRVPEQ